MNLAHALAADLRELVVDAREGHYLQSTVALLFTDLRRVVPSALGVSIVVFHRALDVPLTLDVGARTVQPDEIKAALRIPAEHMVPETTGRCDLYAAEPNAFDAVARELFDEANCSVREAGADPRSTGRVVATDQLPMVPFIPGVSGLTDFTQVNRALGVLYNRGLSWTQARDELQRRADKAGVSLATAAADFFTT